jgi:hypothetical protein
MFLLFVASPDGANAQQLAFPSAEGFGRFASGGRGGEVYYITNLNDSGSGSFRDCVMGSRPAGSRRVCLFATGGRIRLNSDIRMENDNLGNLTIAGQSAPTPVVIDNDFYIGVPNVIMRHLRFRNGRYTDEDGAALLIGYSSGTRNVIVDHVSSSWHRDETLNVVGGESGVLGKVPCADMYGPNEDCPSDVTVQWNLIAEGLGGERDTSPSPAKDLLMYGATRVSFINNIVMHASRRMPFAYDGEVELVNNVMYNYEGYGEPASIFDPFWDVQHVSVIGQNYVPGPSTNGDSVMGIMFNGPNASFRSASSWYLKGNRHPTKRPNDSMSETVIMNVWDQFREDRRLSQPRPGFIAGNAPTVTTAEQALADVQRPTGAGAFMPAWDAVDARLRNELATRKGKIINTIDDVGGWPNYPVQTRNLSTWDSDRDGMPNAWESSNGFNPNDPSDGPRVAANGWTNLENYLNDLAGDDVSGVSPGPVIPMPPSDLTVTQ